MIISASEVVWHERGMFDFLFRMRRLTISRPRKVVVKYNDEKGDLQEGHLDGMISRIFQHEYICIC